MSKYNIEFIRSITVYSQISIEADSDDEAKEAVCHMYNNTSTIPTHGFFKCRDHDLKFVYMERINSDGSRKRIHFKRKEDTNVMRKTLVIRLKRKR